MFSGRTHCHSELARMPRSERYAIIAASGPLTLFHRCGLDPSLDQRAPQVCWSWAVQCCIFLKIFHSVFQCCSRTVRAGSFTPASPTRITTSSDPSLCLCATVAASVLKCLSRLGATPCDWCPHRPAASMLARWARTLCFTWGTLRQWSRFCRSPAFRALAWAVPVRRRLPPWESTGQWCTQNRFCLHLG